jgi:hypothetical protein
LAPMSSSERSINDAMVLSNDTDGKCNYVSSLSCVIHYAAVALPGVYRIGRHTPSEELPLGAPLLGGSAGTVARLRSSWAAVPVRVRLPGDWSMTGWLTQRVTGSELSGAT